MASRTKTEPTTVAVVTVNAPAKPDFPAMLEDLIKQHVVGSTPSTLYDNMVTVFNIINDTHEKHTDGKTSVEVMFAMESASPLPSPAKISVLKAYELCGAPNKLKYSLPHRHRFVLQACISKWNDKLATIVENSIRTDQRLPTVDTNDQDAILDAVNKVLDLFPSDCVLIEEVLQSIESYMECRLSPIQQAFAVHVVITFGQANSTMVMSDTVWSTMMEAVSTIQDTHESLSEMTHRCAVAIIDRVQVQ